MIENIRKYTGLMIVVFVILFISFFFLDTGSVRNMGGGEAVLKIAGRTYNDKEFRTLGTASHDLAMSLAQTGDFGIYQFVMALTTGGTGAQDAEKFFINRMILGNTVICAPDKMLIPIASTSSCKAALTTISGV